MGLMRKRVGSVWPCGLTKGPQKIAKILILLEKFKVVYSLAFYLDINICSYMPFVAQYIVK